MAHITGGGLVDNVPRVLGSHDAWIDRTSWRVPPLFGFLCQRGGVSDDEAYRDFNMGIGMVLFVDPGDESSVVSALAAQGEQALRIGRVERARSDAGEVRWIA
jgi:phosphoribosylformylglycinamidine cyclo-ligase